MTRSSFELANESADDFMLPHILTEQAKKRRGACYDDDILAALEDHNDTNKCGGRRYACCVTLIVLTAILCAVGMGIYVVRSKSAAVAQLPGIKEEMKRLKIDTVIEEVHVTSNMLSALESKQRYVDVSVYCNERFYGVLCSDVDRILGLSVLYFNIRYTCMYNIRFGLLKRKYGNPTNPIAYNVFYEDNPSDLQRAESDQVRIVPQLGSRMLVESDTGISGGLKVVDASPEYRSYRYGYAYEGVMKERAVPGDYARILYPFHVVESIEHLKLDNCSTMARNVTKFVVPTAIRVSDGLVYRLFSFFTNGVLLQYAHRANFRLLPFVKTDSCILASAAHVVYMIIQTAPTLTPTTGVPPPGFTRNVTAVRRMLDTAVNFALRELDATYNGEDGAFFESYVRLNERYSKFMNETTRPGIHVLRTVEEFRSWLPKGTMDPTSAWKQAWGLPAVRKLRNGTFLAVQSSNIRHSLQILDFGNCTFTVLEDDIPYLTVNRWARLEFVGAVRPRYTRRFIANYTTSIQDLSGKVNTDIAYITDRTTRAITINIKVTEDANVTRTFTTLDEFAIYYCKLYNNPSDLRLL